MRKKIIALISIICCMTTSCSDDAFNSQDEETATLRIFVENTPFSRALFTNDYFNDYVSLSVTLVKSGTFENYFYEGCIKQYNHMHVNGPYTYYYEYWSLAGSTSCFLRKDPATVYAVYPYNSNNRDFTSIPISSGQTDYMYGQSLQDVHNRQIAAYLRMNHIMAGVRVAVKRGTVTSMTVNSIEIQSQAFNNTALMNAYEGSLHDLQGNEPVAVNYNSGLTLSSSYKNTDFLLIPSGVTAPLTFNIIDSYGKTSTLTTPPVQLMSGQLLTVNIVMDYGNSLTLENIQINGEDVNSSDGRIINIGNYKVTCCGNTDGLAFNHIVEDGTVTITAIPTESSHTVCATTVTGNATVLQNACTYNNKGKEIVLTDISSDITVYFNGVDKTQIQGSIDLRTAPNGIYAVAPNGMGVPVEEADESCIGVALIADDVINSNGTPLPQRFWIEKNGDFNTVSLVNAYKTDAATSTDYSSLFWGMYGSDNTSITNYTQTGGGGTSSSGYLPKADGTYQTTPNLSVDYTTWTSGALSDFGGKANTAELLAASDTDSNTTYANMSTWCRIFNQTAAENQGYTGWYIPALGQLGLIYLNQTGINDCLSKIGGTALTNVYWSSSEYNSQQGWFINFNVGQVYHDYKTIGSLVRLIRDVVE